MKSLLLTALLFFSVPVFSKNYFVDSSSTNSGSAGTYSSPWKNLTDLSKNLSKLVGGDTVFFKRDQRFKGNFTLYKLGISSTVPIVFMPYGTGKNAPVFEYNLAADTKAAKDRSIITLYQSKNIVIRGFQFTDATMSLTDRSKTAHVGDAISIFESSNIQIKDVLVSLLGNGILIAGDNNLIEACTFSNLRMIVNTKDKFDDDYGATGITVEGSGNRIQRNQFSNCWATSYDYQYDGGAIEIFRTANNNQILYNQASNCEGFIEMGSDNNATLDGNLVAYNLLINNGRVFWINASGTFQSNITNLKFYNNNVIETIDAQSPSKFMIGKSSPSLPGATPFLDLKNNIFWVRTTATLLNDKFINSDFTHQCNLFLFTQPLISGVNGAETPSITANDLFMDAASSNPSNWNYHLKKGSAAKVGCNTGISVDYSGAKITSTPSIGIYQGN